MGKKKSKWLGAIKKLFGSSSSESEKEPKNKSKRWAAFGRSKSDVGTANAGKDVAVAPTAAAVLADEIKEIKAVGFESGQHKDHAYSVALASAVAAEAAAVAAKAAAEVVRLTATCNTGNSARAPARSKEELAAVKIQTAFRGYLARRALRALKGLVRLKALVDGGAVKRQTASTLQAMQALARVQLQIHTRRVKTEEEKRALQKQLQLKCEQELEASKAAEDWDDSHRSKEEIEARRLMRQEAAVKRERSLAYAFSHQWRGSSARTVTPAFADPSNPEWGWSWLERWTASRPWESPAASCVKASRPQSRHSPATPSKGKLRPASPKSTLVARDDDAGSINSVRSEMPRRHGFGDDLSLTGTPPLRRYMQATESTRAKERLRGSSPFAEKPPQRPATSGGFSARKRLSFPLTAADAAKLPSRAAAAAPKVDAGAS